MNIEINEDQVRDLGCLMKTWAKKNNISDKGIFRFMLSSVIVTYIKNGFNYDEICKAIENVHELALSTMRSESISNSDKKNEKNSKIKNMKPQKHV